jgi:HK97 family phage portal protein
MEIFKKWFNQPNKATSTKDFSQVERELYKVNNYTSFLPKLNKAELLEYYNSSPMLRSCVSKISESISTTAWDLFRVTKNGNRTQIFNHELLSLMKDFNPLFSTGIDGWFLVQVYLEVNGNAFIHKERDDSGKIRYLWLYNPLDVEELPTAVNQYNYKVRINNEYKYIPMTEIIQIKKPNPKQPFGYGVGVAETLINEIQTSELANTQINQYFYNGAIPPYIVSADITAEQLKEMSNSWLSNNQGFFNRNKPYFTNTNALTVTKLMDSFKDMEIVKLIEMDAEIVRKTFGIPPEILGGVDNSNRATIQGAREIYAQEVLMPRLLKLKDILNTNLTNEFAENIELDFKSPSPSDKDVQLNIMKTFPDMFDEDEIRKLAGLMPR